MTRPTLLVALLAGPLTGPVPAAEPDDAKPAAFEKEVRPILANHCYACHAADTKPAGGLRVDDRDGLLTGGNNGAAVVPGKPDEGTLLRRITQKGPRQMPLEGEKLSPEQVATLRKWVADGAVWPAPPVPGSLGQPKPKYEELKRDHWAFQPVAKPPVPAVKDAGWPRTAVDRFTLARLEAAGLKPVGDAAKLALVRRLTFDLTGLPTTPAEIDAFLADGSVETLVDRLLASPGYAERWGRHWLDVARYGESTGPSRNIPYPHAWKYRDYVLDAVGRDVPFDRFVREQVAGDLLANAECGMMNDEFKSVARAAAGAAFDSSFIIPHSAFVERDRLLTATGFLALGVKDVNQRFKPRFLMDNVDEQIDAVTRGVLGLTVSCARCHDHKFDPVPTTDYYALAGIFTSTDNCAGVRNQMGGAGLAYYVPDLLVRLSSDPLPPVPEEKLAKLKAEVAEAKGKWDAIRGTPEGLKPAANGQPTQRPFRLKYERLQGELLALTDPAQRGAAAHGVRDGKQIADTAVRLRGEAEKQGPAVPRGFLTAFVVPDARPVNPAQSGRLELAEWLTSANNPLAARVAVNRVWAHLFGRGLVSTVDNFGVTGDAPSHPELLDHLAREFVADGWSVKRLVRRLVLTRTYQLAADATPAHLKLDPANTLLWRHAPRRLTAEEVRDASLLAAGTLDRTPPKGSPAQSLRMVEMRDNGPEAKALVEAADRSRHRSVYLPLVRGVTPRPLEPFDPVDQTLVSGGRDTTTVPAQALFLLNSAFVRKQALTLAERVLTGPGDDDGRLTAAYRLTLGREPTAAERDRGRLFLAEYQSAAREQVAVVTPKPVAPKPAEKPKPAAEIVDPDQADQTGEAVAEEAVQAKDARTAAWLALAQALIGSAEFRYLQ